MSGKEWREKMIDFTYRYKDGHVDIETPNILLHGASHEINVIKLEIIGIVRMPSTYHRNTLFVVM